MVCSEELPVMRVGSFRRHIQDSHPETSNLSQKEREDIASAWTQDAVTEEPESHAKQGKAANFTGCKTQSEIYQSDFSPFICHNYISMVFAWKLFCTEK